MLLPLWPLFLMRYTAISTLEIEVVKESLEVLVVSSTETVTVVKEV